MSSSLTPHPLSKGIWGYDMPCHNLANDVANTCCQPSLRYATATTLALQNGGGDVFMDVKLVRL